MSRALIERRLTDVATRLRKLRDDLGVAEEQLRHFQSDEDDTRVRAIVAENGLAEREHRGAKRAAEAMARHRDQVKSEIETLEKSQDDLLDELSAAAGEGRDQRRASPRTRPSSDSTCARP